MAKTAAHLIQTRSTLKTLRAAAANCQACDLWRTGTQTVFGAGLKRALLMLVVEQPGNDEDLTGIPFVGPDGKLPDRAFADAGIERGDVYVANVVKHFKWTPRRKAPAAPEAELQRNRCLPPRLEAEIGQFKPKAMVLLGATAAQAILGREFRVTRDRRKLLPFSAESSHLATVHPSSILLAPTDVDRRAAWDPRKNRFAEPDPAWRVDLGDAMERKPKPTPLYSRTFALLYRPMPVRMGTGM